MKPFNKNRNISFIITLLVVANGFAATACKEAAKEGGSSEGTISSAPPAPSSSPTPAPVVPTNTPVNLTAAWANDGGDKITQDEKRATTSAASVVNSVWNGNTIQIFGAKNEVTQFNLVLEAGVNAASNVSVQFNTLTGPGGAQITSSAATGNGVFSFTGRNIELFYVKYLQIKGLSKLSYETYDERHVPKRLRRPFTGAGIGTGNWASRPDHDKFYPEIAVPLELVPTFNIAAGQNQSVWTDIYIPKTATAGVYTGSVTVNEGTHLSYTIPVSLTVRNFTLPDMPSFKTMLMLGYSDIALRYTGVAYPNAGTAQDTATATVRNRHFLIAHRHKISIIDSNPGATAWSADAPRPDWLPRLDGSFYTAANGYDGPGVSTSNNIYSIGTYGTWSWRTGATQATMWARTNAWKTWFNTNAPTVEHFLYLIDESTNYAETQQWANWVKTNPGVGSTLKTFATIALPERIADVPDLDLSASWFAVANTTPWQNAADAVAAQSGKKYWIYNGKRPAVGSFATEDDGVALREQPWGAYKKGVDRWFFWESTYYNDYQGGRGQTNVFQTAATFSGALSHDANSLGETGWNHSNGDGVLFYPGTDTVFPAVSMGVQGPFVSLRLKHWRRGIQDLDYVALANAIDPAQVSAIVNTRVPSVLWEPGVASQADPTYQRCDIGWSTNPDDWEASRAQLAHIIDGL